MIQSQNNQSIPQLQIIAALNRLSELSANISDEDRELAAKKIGISKRTIARYEKEGTGKNLDTAMALMKFFRNRIEEREKLIGQ